MKEVILSSLITFLVVFVAFKWYYKDLEEEIVYFKDLFHGSELMWMEEYERNQELEKRIKELKNGRD